MHKIELPVYDETKCFFFSLGRNAMYAACLALGLKSSDRVLTPAFDCDSSLQPFRALGLKLTFLHSNPRDLSIDIDDIKRKITPDVKLIHIINHFGMPQPWEEILKLRAETGIPILEDNAYSLFSDIDGKPFGVFGDMAIFSLRKNLPIPDGGLLRINNKKYIFRQEAKKTPLLYSDDISSAIRIMKTRLGIGKMPDWLRYFIKNFSTEVDAPMPLYSDEEGYPDWPFRDMIGKEFSRDYLRPISRLSEFCLDKFSSKENAAIKDKKIYYYNLLVDRLSRIGRIKIMWPKLPAGAVPFSLLLLFPSKRDHIFRELRQKYYVNAWPIFPGEVLARIEEYPEVKLLGKELLQINLPSEKVVTRSFAKYSEGSFAI